MKIKKPIAASTTIAMFFFLYACMSESQNRPEAAIPFNYVVVLDLSDRLLNPGQAERDVAQIRAVAELFVQKTAMNLTLKSNDIFLLRILPQQGSTLRHEHYESMLSLNMSIADMTDKAAMLDTFIKRLEHLPEIMYAEAWQGNEARNYAGVDIWKYFRYMLNEDLKPGYVNQVVVLTDGYLDFESTSHTLSSGNRHTHNGFLGELAGVDWRKKAEEGDYGYLPVEVPADCSFVISGIRPKQALLTEPEKLEWFWKRWLEESGASAPVFIHDDAPAMMADRLLQKLK